MLYNHAMMQKRDRHSSKAPRGSRRKGQSKATQTAPANKGRRYPAEVLTPGEVHQLMLAPSGRAPTGIRNRALIVCLYRSGLRISEALALMPKDIDRDACSIRVLHGKGDKARTVGMDPEAFAVVERWLDVRTSRGINGHAPVFCTLKGGKLDASYVRALLPRLAKRVGIEKRVHAHGLRHTFASELREERLDIGVISKQLGHSSSATTARYLDHVNPKVVLDAMRQRTGWLDGEIKTVTFDGR